MKNRKTRSRRGFTLTEALVALLIFGLLAAAMASAMPAVMDTFYDATATSEATTLCATLTDSLADLLRYATDIGGTADAPTFSSDRYGSEVTVGATDGRVVVRSAGQEHPLVGEGSYTQDLTADVDLTYDFTAKTFQFTVTVLHNGAESTSSQVTISPLNG